MAQAKPARQCRLFVCRISRHRYVAVTQAPKTEEGGQNRDCRMMVWAGPPVPGCPTTDMVDAQGSTEQHG